MSAKILLLDSDAVFRSGLAENLREDGFDVVECARSSEAPDGDAAAAVMTVVIDYEMADETGLSFADRWHAAHPEVPVILVTAHTSTYIQREIAARPFMCLVRKPVPYAEILALVVRLIGDGRAVQAI